MSRPQSRAAPGRGRIYVFSGLAILALGQLSVESFSSKRFVEGVAEAAGATYIFRRLQTCGLRITDAELVIRGPWPRAGSADL